ncbi:MAG: hypothetical protein AAB726_00695 [Patescibacteria group bacterium]
MKNINTPGQMPIGIALVLFFIGLAIVSTTLNFFGKGPILLEDNFALVENFGILFILIFCFWGISKKNKDGRKTAIIFSIYFAVLNFMDILAILWNGGTFEVLSDTPLSPQDIALGENIIYFVTIFTLLSWIIPSIFIANYLLRKKNYFVN